MLGAIAANRRRVADSAAPFEPGSLFGAGTAGAWYNPSDLSTVFEDSGGTVPAVVGGPVGRVSDKSGNGHHLVQASSGKRPTLRTSGELYWLEFDGNDDALATASGVPLGRGQAAFFAAFQPSTSAVMIIAETSATATNTAGAFYVTANESAGELYVLVNTGGQTGRDVRRTNSGARGAGVTSVLSVAFDMTNPSAEGKIVGRVNAAGGMFQTVQDDADGIVQSFGSERFNLGARDGTVAPFAGRFFGGLLRGGKLTASDIYRMEKWLGARAGVAF